MARSRDVPSKKPSWSLFAAKKTIETGGRADAGAADASAKKTTGSKRKDPPVAVENQRSSSKKSANDEKTQKKTKKDEKNDEKSGKTGKTGKTGSKGEEKKKKKRRFKSAVVSKREINKAQKHGNAGFAAQPTDRLIREIAGELGFEASRFEPRAIRALIEATEQFTIDYLRLTDVLCAHGRRITLSKADSDLASTLLLGNHLFQEENGSAKARLGLLRSMRRDSVSMKNDEKLVPARDRPLDADDAADGEQDDDDDANDADGEPNDANARKETEGDETADDEDEEEGDDA